MTDQRKLHFHNPTAGKLNFNGMIEEVFNYIAEAPEKSYEIIVGCDSSSDERPSFPLALVILRKGYGGRFFLTKIQYPSSEKRRFFNWHQRILQEVFFSCELALSFREAFRKKVASSSLSLDYQFQYIHADIGQSGPTKDMIKEVVGLIKSNGFEAKIKPESFAASVVADRFA